MNDKMIGLFFSIYGVGDLCFGLFFLFMSLLSLRKQRNVNEKSRNELSGNNKTMPKISQINLIFILIIILSNEISIGKTGIYYTFNLFNRI